MITPVIVSRPTYKAAKINSGISVFIFSPLLVHLQIRYDGINVKRSLEINFSPIHNIRCHQLLETGSQLLKV
jgi:hypothetical protein